jgi:hypothetical protein
MGNHVSVRTDFHARPAEPTRHEKARLRLHEKALPSLFSGASAPQIELGLQLTDDGLTGQCDPAVAKIEPPGSVHECRAMPALLRIGI